MSGLNWRCCTKLNRFKKEVKVLIRKKDDHSWVRCGTYALWTSNTFEELYYMEYWKDSVEVPEYLLKDYEYVTLGEL